MHILLGADLLLRFYFFSLIKYFKMFLLEVSFVESKLKIPHGQESKASSRKNLKIDLVAEFEDVIL